MSQRTIERSKASVTLLENNGRIFFFQPDIGVIASDESLEKAYAKFIGARQAYWSEVDGSGLRIGGGSIVPAQEITVSTTGARSAWVELGLFVAKFCIVLVVIAGVGGVLVTRVAGSIGAAIDNAVGPSKSISLADVVRKSSDVVKDLQSLTGEEKEALRRNVAAISRELAPIVDAWRNPPPGQ